MSAKPAIRDALAGLQAGVFGSLLLLACVMLGAFLNGRSVWVFPNLMATLITGSGAYRNEYLNTSWAGAAILVLIYGSFGVVWGIAWGDGRKSGLMALGAVTGLVVYYLFFHWIWFHLAPVITLYAPDRQLELGHVLWGAALGRSPGFARRIAAQQPAVAEAEVIR